MNNFPLRKKIKKKQTKKRIKNKKIKNKKIKILNHLIKNLKKM